MGDDLELRILRLGKVRFADLERFQAQLAQRRAADEIPDTLIFAEHPYTLTTGIRSRDDHHHVDFSELASYGIELHESPERGGSTTILGPGQLTVYPVVDAAPIRGLKNYMDAIEYVIHEVASDLGARTEIGVEHSSTYGKPYHCVWHRNEEGVRHKLMAQGYKNELRGSKNVISRGGFSLYVSPEAHKHFRFIDHCGFKTDEVPPISLAEITSGPIDQREVERRLIGAYAKRFGYSRILD